MRNYYRNNTQIKFILTVIWICSVIFIVNGKQIKKNKYSSTYEKEFFESSIYEDSILKTPGLIQKYNYPMEVHDVLTEDGYILEMHRIPNPGKVPVYLQHGLASSSAEFVFYGSKVGLGFHLYDAGYDVWLGNHRGNRYSKRHITLNQHDIRFWNFTLTELGKYDVKAFIDYVTSVTKYDKIHYIGNSQGCSVIVILCDDSPEYADKLIGVQAMAPAVYVKHLTSPLVKIVVYIMNRYKHLLPFFEGTFLKNVADMGYGPALSLFCHDGSPTQAVCGYLVSAAVGFNMVETNKTRLPVIVNHFPSGTSIKQAVHFKQMFETGEFKKYDYGRKGNLRQYGQEKPPFYDINKMKAKYSVYHSSNDALVVKKDVDKLFNQLPNPHNKILYDDYSFNHLNFVAGIHCENFYNKYLIKTMKSLDN